MLYPSPIQSLSSNSSQFVDLFSGIFYTIRILGAGNGLIRPSAIPSIGGIYLEQDINPENSYSTNTHWSFSPSSIPGYYEWGLYSLPSAKVGWVPGDTDNDFPLQLRNLSEVIQDIYEDPESSLWEFETSSGQKLNKSGFKIRPMNFGQTSGVTFTPKPKSPRGWWLQLNKNSEEEGGEDGDIDHFLIFQPINYKLYAESAHMDLGNVQEITTTSWVKKYIRKDFLNNPTPKERIYNLTVASKIEYDVYVQADKEFDIFSGITVIHPKTTPSRKYFDLERAPVETLNLKGVAEIVGREEVEIEPFSNQTVSSYVTYLKEFKGLRYYSWTDVTAVADILSNGRVVKNVLLQNVDLLKHLIRGKGYKGEFWDVHGQDQVKGQNDAARIRIKTSGVVRGSLPIPFVQFTETEGDAWECV